MVETEVAVACAFDDHTAFDVASPERNLMRAVLRSAMDDVKKQGELYRDARRFFMNAEDDYLFSFISICSHLGICHGRVRRALGLISDYAEKQAKAAKEDEPMAA